MQNEEKNEGEIQIDFGRIFAFIIRRWWILLICLVIGGAAGFIVGKKQESTTYTLQANYTVGYQYDDSSSSSNSSQLTTQVSDQSRVAAIIPGMMTTLDSNRFYKAVAEQCNTDVGKSNYITEKAVEACLTFDYSTTNMQVAVTKGNVIYITVASNDSTKTKNVMTATTEILVDYIRANNQMAQDSKILFDRANDPEEPTVTRNSNTVKFLLLGGVGCALVAAVVLAIIVIADQRIKNETDLSDRYGIPVLGSIPDFEDKNLKKGGYYHDYKYKEE